MNDPVMLVFPREEVEAQNVAPLLRRFAPDKLPRGRDLAAMMPEGICSVNVPPRGHGVEAVPGVLSPHGV